MSKEDGTLWEIPRQPDTEWLFESNLDEEEKEPDEQEKKSLTKPYKDTF